MNKEETTAITGILQIFFEEPFWVGVFERTENGRLSVCKVTFGPEPKDYEVQNFIMEHFDKLRFSPSVEVETTIKLCKNPKRLQREVKKQIVNVGIGTKSQQALKLQQEQAKKDSKIRSKLRREEEQLWLFQLKQEKKKEKHKGR